jgi:hypothetical protein
MDRREPPPGASRSRGHLCVSDGDLLDCAVASVASPKYVDNSPARGARIAKREERAYFGSLKIAPDDSGFMVNQRFTLS